MTRAYLRQVGVNVREARGWSTAYAASVAQMAAPTWSSYEAGNRDMGVEGLARVAAALGVPAGSLLPEADVPGEVFALLGAAHEALGRAGRLLGTVDGPERLSAAGFAAEHGGVAPQGGSADSEGSTGRGEGEAA